MSRDKAKDGSVKVTINREEVWVRPEDLKIGEKTFKQINTEFETLKTDYQDFRENTLLTLGEIIKSDKENKRLFKRLEKSLEDFMAKVIKGGF